MTGIILYPVESGVMSHVGFDEPTRTLSILFHTGKRYEYDGVPEQVFKDFMDAPSKGRFFNDHIDEKYPYRLMSGRPAEHAESHDRQE